MTLASTLEALRLVHGPSTGMTIAELAAESASAETEVRAAIRAMLQFEPPWVDADVLPEQGMTWWLTAAGATAATHGA